MKTQLIAIAAFSLSGGFAASAATLDFQYRLAPGGIVIDASWIASSTPTPLSNLTGAFTDVPVTNGTFEFGPAGGPFTMGSFTDVTFYNAAFSGPLGPGGFQASLVGDFGPQIYSGAESAPAFTAGVYTLAFGTLTVSTVPEPATWTLLLLGFGSLGAFLRRRVHQSA